MENKYYTPFTVHPYFVISSLFHPCSRIVYSGLYAQSHLVLNEERCATSVSLILCTAPPLAHHSVWPPSTSVAFFVTVPFSDLVSCILNLKTFHIKNSRSCCICSPTLYRQTQRLYFVYKGVLSPTIDFLYFYKYPFSNNQKFEDC